VNDRPTQTNDSEQPRKRIVLYGRPASGKTCFLAALAMARLPHPMQYFCVWACDAQTIPTPPGPRESWDPQDPGVSRFLGKEWLQSSIDAIERGDVPPATPHLFPFRLLFDLTLPDGRLIRLEMIDYSGELVDPNLAEDMLVRKLLEHLEEADGLMVLAEAPRPTDDVDQAEAQMVGQYRELQVLQQALRLVAEKRRKRRADPVPIALLMNKWDRYSKASRFDAEAIEIEKDQFLGRKPPPPQQVLLNVLKAVAGSLGEDPYSESFAVSAFGETKTAELVNADGTRRLVEVPIKLIPLQSYGLEGPLVWICEKSDALEMHELTTEVAALKPWKTWQVPTGRALGVRSQIVRLKRWVPAHLPRAKALGVLAREAQNAYVRQLGMAAMLVIGLFGGVFQFGMYQYDNFRYTRIYPSIKAAENSASPIEWAEKWKEAGDFLASYAKPSWSRFASHHYLLSPDSARRTLASLQPRLIDAERILGIRHGFDVRLDGIASRANQVEDPGQLATMREEAAGQQVPMEYPEGDAKKAAILAEVDKRIEAVQIAKLGEDLRQKVAGLMGSARLAEVAVELAAADRRSPTIVAELRADFQARWDAILLNEARTHCESSRWDLALRAIEEFENSTEAVALAGPNGRLRRTDLRNRIDKHRSEVLYARWHDDPYNLAKQEDLRTYGASADRERLSAWKAYTDFASQERKWFVSMQEIYQPNYGGSFGVRATTTCYWEGTEVCSDTSTFTTVPQTITTYASGSALGKLESPVKITVNYQTLNFNYGNTSGQGTWTGTPLELLNGVAITVVTGEYGYPVVKLKASTSDAIPSKPELRTPEGGIF